MNKKLTIVQDGKQGQNGSDSFPRQNNDFVEKIKGLRRSGDVAQAFKLVENFLAESPRDVLLLKELANINFSLENDQGVIDALDRVRATEPLGPHATQLYERAKHRLAQREAQSLRRSGGVRDAIVLLETLLVESPQAVSLLKELANARFSIEDDQGVIEALDRVRAIEPLGKHTTHLYAQSKQRLALREAHNLRRSGDNENAIKLIETLLVESPQEVLLLKALANARFSIKDDQGVIEALDRVRAIEPLGKHTTLLRAQAMRRLARRKAQKVHYYYNLNAPDRLPIDEMVENLAAYDVISFDIFDTAIVRAVAEPNHVFRIMGSLLSVTDFVKKRKQAEAHARTHNDRIKGTREVTLDDIYAVLEERCGPAEAWKQLEKKLEIQLTRKNPYIFQVYERLRALGKRLVFTSDMYLPRETLEAMIAQAGYLGYEQIYLSNEHSARKGDGTLQKILIADCGPNCTIAHVGDVYDADVRKSIEAGIAGLHNPNQFSLIREKDMSNLAGSFYEAVINNAIGTGTWSEGLHYTHGFRVGGILALGFVEFLERLAKDKASDKILFFGRDCDILFQVYNRWFGALPSAYVDTSRVASLMLTAERNFDDYVGRTFFRWFKESNNSRPLQQLLIDSGFDYLIDKLEAADIEPLQFPASANESRLRDFFWEKKSVIEDHLAEMRENARDYFASAIGDARKVLAVDIGWTGTCIASLRDFFQSSFGDNAPQVHGALLATSRNELITDEVSNGSVSAYLYTPLMNQDIARLMMPVGKFSRVARDMLTHPIEYLFTEPKATTIGYTRDSFGKPVAIRGANVPPNTEQILEMQRGVLDFIGCYLDYSKGLNNLRKIGPYTAFQPLRNSLGHERYLYEVYKDFVYDAVSVLHSETVKFPRYGELFDHAIVRASTEEKQTTDCAVRDDVLRPRILFVSQGMNYDGSPHSLLRICKVARELGYDPIVWTARPGPFSREFEKTGFPVIVVPETCIDSKKIAELIRENVKLVVCNTVVTDRYVSGFQGKLPLVWYVREATNLPQFLRGNPKRAEMLRRSSSVVVVSDYAARALGEFADGPVEVVKNAVEDVTELALPYSPMKDGVVRFVQLGTIEHRKGYDLFVAAYKAMPAKYRARAELHFAGGFINSGTSFASYLLGQTRQEPSIHFHGLIDNKEQKIKFLSQMDVVVVASRDESCSLVALEGAMLSKPIIVTENVGAKYMVDDDNGIIVPSGEVISLRDAFMRMIDLDVRDFSKMGEASRRKYDKLASMENHSRELGDLFARRIAEGPMESIPASPKPADYINLVPSSMPRELIISLTSFPPRMSVISRCISSLKSQTKKADRILLWLSVDQFPKREEELPEDLLECVDQQFNIRWVEGDLGPHKKYFYTMQEFPEAHVITVDDDVAYDDELVATLYEGHLSHPDCVIAGRANLIRFRPDGMLRSYDHWGYEHQFLRETETFALLPTGIGGVLYPAHSLPTDSFNVDVVRKTCLHADDLWLKTMTTLNGYPVWMPNRRFGYPNISGSQNVALWRGNWFRNGNDVAIASILEYFEQRYGNSKALLRRIQGVRPDGTFVGPGDELDRSPLLGVQERWKLDRVE